MAPWHVAQVNFVPAPEAMSWDELFVHWCSLGDIPAAAAHAGTRISFVQAASRNAQLTRDGVDYHFTQPSQLADVLALLQPDVLHVHGLEHARHLAPLVARLGGVPVLLQDHANRVPNWWRRPFWRRWYGIASAVTFTSLEQAEPFRRLGLFPATTRWFAIPESSNRFTPGDRETAREITGLYGHPCVISVGHLSEGKDPLTLLEGVAQAAAQLPDLQLWLVYSTGAMREAMEQHIATDARLRGRVHFLGRVEPQRVQTLLRASDLFVSASLRESCGYAAMEAMACGVTPILTDIPSFRVLTDHGRIGSLWPCGDATALANALIEQSHAPPQRHAIREHFDDELSFAAVGRRWADAYAQLCQKQPIGVS